MATLRSELSMIVPRVDQPNATKWFEMLCITGSDGHSVGHRDGSDERVVERGMFGHSKRSQDASG